MTKTPSFKPDRLKATLMLDEPASRISGVSASRAGALEALGITKVRDVLTHYPRRYLDLSNVCNIAQAKIGSTATIVAEVVDIKVKRPKRNLQLAEITLNDGTSTLIATFFHQPWLAKKIHAGDKLALAGKITFDFGFKRMTNPILEDASNMVSCGKVLPVHPATEKVSAAWMRRIMEAALKQCSGILDALPTSLRLKRNLMSRQTALRNIHFPASVDEAACARDTLVYWEVLLTELQLMKDSNVRSEDKTPTAHVTDGPRLAAFKDSLPFTLTDEQTTAVADLLGVMGDQSVANHMILGDVGSGKTVVAAHGIVACADTGGQSMLLVPTEILAEQHFHTLCELFTKTDVTCALLTGSTSKEDRQEMLERFEGGTLDLLIGTHALLEDDVVGKNVTFVIIDEQQRFGVNQRAHILEKGYAPDALYLTATPIPRSLALAIFGNLTLSYIKSRPFKQAKRTTEVLSRQAKGRAYDFAKEALGRGEQVYVVCPLIGVDADKRDALSSKDDDAEEDVYHPDVSIDDFGTYSDDNPAAAETEARFLQEKIFTDYHVGLLHGSMSSEDKKAAMDAFKAKEIDVLVSTTVIEVGVDVENATVMIIEDADRFGLSQLHQLRGRVGRGNKDSQVFLISASKKEEALVRLSAMQNLDDGFKLAEYDLALRREGDIMGNRQSGRTNMKLVNIMKDASIIEAAHDDAAAILKADPTLSSDTYAALGHEVRMCFENDGHIWGG